jgi:hypothetical protein
MRLVKVGANHYINADRMIEVYPHLVEPGLTIVMGHPRLMRAATRNPPASRSTRSTCMAKRPRTSPAGLKPLLRMGSSTRPFHRPVPNGNERKQR